MIKLLISCVCIFWVYTLLYADIIVNELMPVPDGKEPEWLEIYNTSSETYKQEYLIICDIATCRTLHNFILEGSSFCIIAKDTTLFKEHRNIAPNIRLYQFNIPTLNNTFDSVKIYNKDTVLLDDLFYDMKFGKKGISLERIFYNEKARTPDNLKPSIELTGATPGKVNSLFPREDDIAITTVEQNNDDFSISLILENLGHRIIPDCLVILKFDKNFDDNFDNSEIFFETHISTNDKLTILEIPNKIAPHFSAYSGYYEIQIELIAEEDNNTTNNTMTFKAYLSGIIPKITINEIMFETSQDVAEYIEFYNHESAFINLHGFKLYDRATINSPDYVLSNLRVKPTEYFVIAYDSLIFNNFEYLDSSHNINIPLKKLNLNNSDDLLIFATPDNVIIDSLTYYKTWHLRDDIVTRNRSLEKIHIEMISSSKDSWTTCLNPLGGTPGMQNSTYVELKSETMLDASPNPFSPYSTSGNNHCLISYNLTFDKAKITAKVYDLSASCVRTIISEHWTSNEGFFAWDGRDDAGFILPLGPYILHFEAISSPSGTSFKDKLMIVIGE